MNTQPKSQYRLQTKSKGLSTQDISAINLQERILVDHPQDSKYCFYLRKKTPARICEGRAGDRYKTETYLRLRADHALAIDAVWADFDESIVDEFQFVKVQSLVQTREEYLRYPERGRRFSAENLKYLSETCIVNPDIQIVVADGLSAKAIEVNLSNIYQMIRDGVHAKDWVMGTPIFVRFGRVGSMDRISELLHPKVTVLLVGERPGLSGGGESMSCYAAYEASTQKPESQRTVISNIHPHGLIPVEAGAQILSLIEKMLTQKTSGIDLK